MGSEMCIRDRCLITAVVMWILLPLGAVLILFTLVGAPLSLLTLLVVLPILWLVGLIVVGTAVYIGAYAQQFLFAITFNNVREIQPLPAGLFEFVGYQDTTWNELMAAALTGITPVMIVFLFLQKFLVAGLTAGAVKE